MVTLPQALTYFTGCRYFPPDFDPADLPKGQRGQDNAMKVRMMLPMTVRCQTCGEFMYKGTKFNCKKEDVVGETYLGLQIFRFYMRCRKCSAEITYLTDPQNKDYKMEHGATRNFEQWKQVQTIEEALKSRREEEDEDKVKRLENKTADAKREMDMMGVLDDMLHTKGQHAAVSTEEAIAALKAKAAEDAREAGVLSADFTPEDEAALQHMVAAGAFTNRLEDDDVEARVGVGLASKRPALAPPKRSSGVQVKVQKVSQRRASCAAAGPTTTQSIGASACGRQGNEAGAQRQGVAQASGVCRVGAGSETIAADGLGLGGYGGSSSSDGSSPAAEAAS
jgi:hypothetical protein